MVKIVNIVPIKRKGNIRKVIDDNGNEYILALDIIIQYHIKKEQDYDYAKWQEILRESDMLVGLEYAYAVIARGRYTIHEMRQKLYLKKISDQAVNAVIDRLIELGYLDDCRFCEDYIESYSNTWGKIRIRNELIRKGIDKAIIEDLIVNIDNEQELAYQLANKFNKGTAIDTRQRERIIRHLINKGFDYETVLSAIRRLGAERDDIYDI